MTLELRIQQPTASAFSKMLWSHPHLGCNPGETEAQGLPDHIWVPRWSDCIVCRQPTTWTEINFEAAMCPGVCTEQMDRNYWKALREAGPIADFVP